jgi:hypothetical protein
MAYVELQLNRISGALQDALDDWWATSVQVGVTDASYRGIWVHYNELDVNSIKCYLANRVLIREHVVLGF